MLNKLYLLILLFFFLTGPYSGFCSSNADKPNSKRINVENLKADIVRLQAFNDIDPSDISNEELLTSFKIVQDDILNYVVGRLNQGDSDKESTDDVGVKLKEEFDKFKLSKNKSRNENKAKEGSDWGDYGGSYSIDIDRQDDKTGLLPVKYEMETLCGHQNILIILKHTEKGWFPVLCDPGEIFKPVFPVQYYFFHRPKEKQIYLVVGRLFSGCRSNMSASEIKVFLLGDKTCKEIFKTELGSNIVVEPLDENLSLKLTKEGFSVGVDNADGADDPMEWSWHDYSYKLKNGNVKRISMKAGR